MEIYYIYQHRRLDTNEVFYVGMAKLNPKRNRGQRTKYERAYAAVKRPQHWKEIGLYVKFCVEIIMETPVRAEAEEKERNLIALYGRKSREGGTLCNLSAGGGINNDVIQNAELRISQIDLSGRLVKVWKNPMEIEREVGFLRTNIIKCCRKKQVTAYGYIWDYTDIQDYKNIKATSSRKRYKKAI